MQLVDTSDKLEGLIRFPGLASWTISDKAGNFYKSFGEAEGKFSQTMFPPDNISSLDMEKCIRVYPFSQNTGGFFVAVFEKLSAFGSVDRANERRDLRMEKEEDSATAKKVLVDPAEQSIVVEEPEIDINQKNVLPEDDTKAVTVVER